jgi:hypothetical protein
VGVGLDPDDKEKAKVGTRCWLNRVEVERKGGLQPEGQAESVLLNNHPDRKLTPLLSS